MVGDAIVKMLTAVRNKKFRLNSGFSPFSYFTTIAFHAFINRIKKEKKQHEAVKEYREKKYAEMICSQHIPNGGIYLEPLKNDDSGEYDY
jgi:DNA-directed RNA polymerase specialized sigma24 family protein